MRKGYAMKKKHIILTVLFALMLGTATFNTTQAQIFIMDEDDQSAPRASGSFPIPDVPWQHDSTLDYTPVGNGIWVLGCLGAAYLIGKRRKEEE